jgi:hypothetical protein
MKHERRSSIVIAAETGIRVLCGGKYGIILDHRFPGEHCP